MFNTKSNVLLPSTILSQRNSISEDNFNILVCQYLKRYPNYQFVEMNGNFAVCVRQDEVAAKGRRGKK